VWRRTRRRRQQTRRPHTGRRSSRRAPTSCARMAARAPRAAAGPGKGLVREGADAGGADAGGAGCHVKACVEACGGAAAGLQLLSGIRNSREAVKRWKGPATHLRSVSPAAGCNVTNGLRRRARAKRARHADVVSRGGVLPCGTILGRRRNEECQGN
jgi:hypothetical protein